MLSILLANFDYATIDKTLFYEITTGKLFLNHAYAFIRSEYDADDKDGWSWKATNNANPDAMAWEGRVMGIHYYDKSKGPELYIMINLYKDSQTWTLPDGGEGWKIIVDTQAYFEDKDREENDIADGESGNINTEGYNFSGSTYGINGFSIVILEKK